MACNAPSWTHFQDFYKHASQISSAITLTQDQYYYVEIKHKENGGGNNHVTVGVEIPNTADFWPVNYIYAKLSFEVVTNYVKESFHVSVWNYDAESEMAFFLRYMDPETGEVTDSYKSDHVPVNGNC